MWQGVARHLIKSSKAPRGLVEVSGGPLEERETKKVDLLDSERFADCELIVAFD